MKKNTISEVEIFSMKSSDGGRRYGINCKLNGVKQSSKILSRDDVIALNMHTNRRELAKKYFCPEPKEDSTTTQNNQ